MFIFLNIAFDLLFPGFSNEHNRQQFFIEIFHQFSTHIYFLQRTDLVDKQVHLQLVCLVGWVWDNNI